MRKLPAMLLLTAALPGQIEWLHPLDAALPKAKQDERPIILYFTFDT